MANIKISELPAASAASTTQEFETNDSGTSKKITGSQLKAFVKNGFVVADVTDLTATATELNYTDGVTSAIQTQLNSKAPTASPVFSGNMGLGVTPFSWGVDRTVFDLKNTAVYSSPSNYGGFANNAYYNGSGWVYKYSDFAQAYECGGGFHSWYTAPSGTAGNPVTWTKRLSINSSGAFGINNDYGTSGQVITSAGSGAAPTWSNLSSAQVGSATAGITTGDVGSYAFLGKPTVGTLTTGASYAGSSLNYCGSASVNTFSDNTLMGFSGITPPGTWRCMGAGTVAGRVCATLFMRIA